MSVNWNFRMQRHNGVTSKKEGCLYRDCKYLKPAGLLVEQRGIEPLASALRTRRSAKLSYCPTQRAY
jgi:hypothetical protein